MATATLILVAFWLYMSTSVYADERDCSYWICDGYRETEDLPDYENCTAKNTNWKSGQLYTCTYCQVTDNGTGACWCDSRQNCQQLNTLVIGISLIVLSLLSLAIMWFKYAQKYKQMAQNKQLLLQREESARRASKYTQPKSTSKSRSRIAYDTYTSYEKETVLVHCEPNVAATEGDSVYAADDDDTESSCSGFSVNHEIKGEIQSMRSDLSRIRQCNLKCVALWTCTALSCGAFLAGLLIVIPHAT